MAQVVAQAAARAQTVLAQAAAREVSQVGVMEYPEAWDSPALNVSAWGAMACQGNRIPSTQT